MGAKWWGVVVVGLLVSAVAVTATLAATTTDVHQDREHARAHDHGDTHDHEGTDEHRPAMSHGHGPRDFDGVWAAATPSERAGAGDLMHVTTAAVARYQDVSVALADGFRPNPNQHGRIVHYPNLQNRRDDRVLDASALEGLVYLRQLDDTLRLVAALYTTRGGSVPPAPGGEITTWHSHTPGCAHPTETPGCERAVRMYMLHVWLGPGVHDPFADTFRAAR